MAGALRLAADQIDHHLLAAVVQLVHPVVHGEDALGERRIGLGERLCGKRDHLRHLVGGIGELALQVRDGLWRELLGEVRDVACHLVDMRQVADQAKCSGHFPQIIGHQRLLHEHDVKAAVLDGLAQPARRLAAGKHALGGIGVAGKRTARGPNVEHRLLGQLIDQRPQLLQLVDVTGTGLHQLNLPVR